MSCIQTRGIYLAAIGFLVLCQVAAAAAQPDTKSLKGKPAPEVDLKTIDGQTVKLSEQKGHVVVLDYWATWCGPCRQSLPHLQKLSNDEALKSQGLKVFAVNSKETEDKVKPFLEKNKFTFTVPMDTAGKFGKDYLVHGIPTTVIVGRDGNVKSVFIGYGKTSDEKMEAAIKEALAEGQST